MLFVGLGCATADSASRKLKVTSRSTGAKQRWQKEGPDHYRDTSQNNAQYHSPGQMFGTKIPSPRGVRVLVFLLFSLLSMGKIAFVVHIVSLFIAPSDRPFELFPLCQHI